MQEIIQRLRETLKDIEDPAIYPKVRQVCVESLIKSIPTILDRLEESENLYLQSNGQLTATGEFKTKELTELRARNEKLEGFVGEVRDMDVADDSPLRAYDHTLANRSNAEWRLKRDELIRKWDV